MKMICLFTNILAASTIIGITKYKRNKESKREHRDDLNLLIYKFNNKPNKYRQGV